MAEISNVYGANYFEEAKRSRINHVAKILAANISNYQFEQHLDMSSLWNEDNSLKLDAVNILVDSILQNNPKMAVTHINKQSNDLNMLPYFIQGDSVEYFRVIDTVRSKIIFFFVTPKGTGVY
tara:strand:- start:45 stop:413 length:369 start_codon:yes stop_codon:yes gene_type:complete